MFMRHWDGSRLSVLCGVFLVTASPLWGQTPGGAISAEQKLDLAIRKIEDQDLKEADRLIKEVELEKPNLVRLQLVRGLLYKSAPGRGTQAIAELEQYNAKDEARSEWRGFAAVGELYLNSRMFSSALRPLERAKDIAPAKENGKSVRSEILMNLATAYVGLQNNKLAVKVAKEGQAAAPDDADVQLRLSQIAAQANDAELSLAAVEQAITLYKNDIRDDPFNRMAHDRLLQCFSVASSLCEGQRRGDPENAEPYFRAGRLVGQISEIRRRLAMLDSLQLVHQAIERSPKNTEYRLVIVELEYALGGMKDSIDMIDKVLEIDPKNEQAAQWNEKLKSAPPRPVVF
ncbi:MAG TPA: tetratricopeptide repeat protein [Phycisphaerae bacterium]|nr:tetratricopeptide repeat protein [Phycisphaerae bacterium]